MILIPRYLLLMMAEQEAHSLGYVSEQAFEAVHHEGLLGQWVEGLHHQQRFCSQTEEDCCGL